jgi:hypothetical protein
MFSREHAIGEDLDSKPFADLGVGAKLLEYKSIRSPGEIKETSK